MPTYKNADRLVAKASWCYWSQITVLQRHDGPVGLLAGLLTQIGQVETALLAGCVHHHGVSGCQGARLSYTNFPKCALGMPSDTELLGGNSQLSPKSLVAYCTSS